MSTTSIQRVDFGHFIRPPDETGTGFPRPEPCLGYVVSHARGVLLVDTGMGSHPEVDEYYRTRRIPLPRALSAIGVARADVAYLVNCHLHFDHCGGNVDLAGRPVFTQRVEIEAARSPGYTLPELVDAPGLTYELLDGEAEILDGVFVVPTPGHTAGHQSVVVRQADGTVVVAGQSHDNATAFGTDALNFRLGRHGRAGDLPVPPAWMDRLLGFDPRRVVFAHDGAVWVP